MYTEPTPVQRHKPPSMSELPDPVAGELEDVTIRVVRLNQLAPALPPPLPAAAAPAAAMSVRRDIVRASIMLSSLFLIAP